MKKRKNKKYVVVKDLQDSEFMIGVSKTRQEWKAWALADRKEADNMELYSLFEKTKPRKIIKLIEKVYSIKLKGQNIEKLPFKLKINLLDIVDNDLNDKIFDAITEYLSDKYGLCVNCVSIEKDTFKIKIDW